MGGVPVPAVESLRNTPCGIWLRFHNCPQGSLLRDKNFINKTSFNRFKTEAQNNWYLSADNAVAKLSTVLPSCSQSNSTFRITRLMSFVCLYHRERAPVPHCRGGWVGPKAGLDGYGEKSISYSQQDSNHRQSSLASRCRTVKYVPD
jgi:hypothetical protein